MLTTARLTRAAALTGAATAIALPGAAFAVPSPEERPALPRAAPQSRPVPSDSSADGTPDALVLGGIAVGLAVAAGVTIRRRSGHLAPHA